MYYSNIYLLDIHVPTRCVDAAATFPTSSSLCMIRLIRLLMPCCLLSLVRDADDAMAERTLYYI
jgi:hypothetical protein